MSREVVVKFSLGDDVAKQEFEEWLQTAGDHVYLVDMPEASSPVQLVPLDSLPKGEEPLSVEQAILIEQYQIGEQLRQLDAQRAEALRKFMELQGGEEYTPFKPGDRVRVYAMDLPHHNQQGIVLGMTDIDFGVPEAAKVGNTDDGDYAFRFDVLHEDGTIVNYDESCIYRVVDWQPAVPDEAEKRAFERDPDEPTAHIARTLDELANYNDGEYALVDMLSCAWLALSRAHSFAQSSLPGLPGWPKDTMAGLKSAHATVTELLREDAAGA